MDFRFTEEEEAFRKEVSQWLEKEVPQRWHELDLVAWEETDESWAISREFQRKLGQKGWLASAYPKEYGGGELGTMKRLILAEELASHRAPVGVEVAIAVDWVGPSLLLFGTEEQKQKYVTGIAKGELAFCLGYSEPNAGSDLASLQTRAVESGDSWIINGQKIWTSVAHYADYMWLAARTDPDAPKHRGVSMFVVDMKTPGITVRPLINLLNRHSFNEVFFDDVHIPKDSLVGQKHLGWYHLAAALDYERSGLSGGSRRVVDGLVQYVKETERNGQLLAKDPVIRQEIAQIAIDNEIARMMSYRIAWMFSKGLRPSSEASMSFLVNTQLTKRLMNTGIRITGLYGLLERDSKWAVLNARMLRTYLVAASSGVGGGTTEIQRNIIATRGLGLPRR
jgi:alkylation response protein AidB-like acyl-CoA dehydrogenase